MRYLINTDKDLIYFIIPPNLLSMIILFGLNNKVKIIVDIIDLWPESVPHGNSKLKKTLIKAGSFFATKIRNLVIKRSTYCITESEYFYDKLCFYRKKESHVIQIKKINHRPIENFTTTEDLSIAYLGNIGAIYDFSSLFKIIIGLSLERKVILHILGSGPKKSWFFTKLKQLKIKHVDYGISFDEARKKDALAKCWFGFNGYLHDVEVALSYKSIDYLSFGIPLINFSKGDIRHLVSSNNIGFNYDIDNIDLIIKQLSKVKKSDILKLKQNAYHTFLDKFSEKSYFESMDEIIDKIRF